MQYVQVFLVCFIIACVWVMAWYTGQGMKP